MNDPERLLDAGASPFERYLLDAAANEKPPLELVNAMQAGLGLGAKTGAIASAAGGSGVAGYVAVAVLGLGAALAGYVALQSPAKPQPVPLKPAPAVVASPNAAPVEAAPAAEAPPTAPAPAETSPAPGEAAPIPKRASTASKASVGDELRQELKLLDEARAALKGGAPARARTLLEQHARRFPNGSFRQEADVLRVETLERLGERQKAASLAREFLSEHPESPHVERVGKAASSAR